MKITTIILCLFSILTSSCSPDVQALRQEARTLREEKRTLSYDISNLSNQKRALQYDINSLRKEKQIYASGRVPEYIVVLRIKQSTVTLDIGEHIKNEMNAVVIEIPTTKPIYESLSVGKDFENSFKMGSLIFNGDFSNLHIEVQNKYIK